MKNKKLFANALWIFIILIILFNGYLLFKLKKESLSHPPFENLDIQKPTLVIILDENECVDCIRNLLFLNDLYTSIKEEGKIDFMAIILSPQKADPKDISNAFIFPVKISDDFKILSRLNMNRTPLIVGLTADRRIIHCDLVPFEIGVSREYIEKTVLDRLYYSLSFD